MVFDMSLSVYLTGGNFELAPFLIKADNYYIGGIPEKFDITTYTNTF